MNRRAVRIRSLGDDAVTAAAAAAVATAAGVANQGVQPTAPAHRRKKHRPHRATPAVPAANATNAGKTARKRMPHRGAAESPTPMATGDKAGTATMPPGQNHGYLLIIGGVVLGLGALALLLGRRKEEPAAHSTGEHNMSVVTLEGASQARPATCNPKVTYRGLSMEWDYYEQAPGLGVLHIVCPHCTHIGLIASANKRFTVDERGRVSVDEPFRCDYCHWRFGVTDSRMLDA